MEHFFQTIDGWSELHRQGILLETLLKDLNKNELIIIAEIGVYKGRGTAMWNSILLQNGVSYKYYAIDNL